MLKPAIQCYQLGLISLGKAVEFSELQRSEFESLLAEHEIERPGSPKHLQSDLDWAKAGNKIEPVI